MQTKDKKSTTRTTPNIRMDDLQNTIREYGNQLYLFNKHLVHAQEKKKKFQEQLLREREQTSKLRAQLEALKGKKKEMDERERCRTSNAERLSVEVEKARAICNEKLQQQAELRLLIDRKICEIESASADILTRFKSLQLKDSEDLSLMEEESAIMTEITLLKEEIALLQRDKENLIENEGRSHLPLNVMKNILDENNSTLMEVEELTCTLQQKIGKLEKELKQQRDKKDALDTEA